MKFKQIEILFQQMSCSLRLPRAPPEAATPPLTTPPTCLLSAEAARVVVSLSACLSACQSPFLSLCLLFASSATSRVFCVRFEASCKLAASSVLRRFVALFNLDKLKTMPQTPHTLLQLPTLFSSCMRQGSCRLRPPPGSPLCRTLVYCSRAQQAASTGNAAHAPCNIRAIDAAAIEAEIEKRKTQWGDLPPATWQLAPR